jgi:pyruvate kinase
MSNILCTIGPISQNYSNLKKILNHSNFVRLNGAHNTIDWHTKTSNLIKKINPNCKILIDLPGIKPRTANLEIIKIKKNQIVKFYFAKKNLNKNKNSLNIPLTKPLPKFGKIKNFTVADGRYNFEYISHGKNFILGKSIYEVNLLPKKGLNIPGSVYSDILQEKIYLNFLKKISKLQIDAIGLSYVQNSKIIKRIKKKTNKIIVSKVENSLGCSNAKEISENSDIIMIDRGDLSAEIGENNLYKETINISKFAKKNGRLLIMATENLESMIYNSAPSKSEIISLSFSKSLNADYLMLSDETATAKKFLSILKWFKNFNEIENKDSNFKKNQINTSGDIFSALSKVNEKSSKIVIFTRKGYVIEKILNINPRFKLFIFTDSQKIYDLSSLRYNVSVVKTVKFTRILDKFIYNNIDRYKNKIFYRNNDIFLIYAAFARKNSRANTLSVLNKKDFY